MFSKKPILVAMAAIGTVAIAVAAMFFGFRLEKSDTTGDQSLFPPAGQEARMSKREEDEVKIDAEEKGYKLYGFGNLTIRFDSTTRTNVPYLSQVYTPEELTEQANQYVVDVQDVDECSTTRVKSMYIVDGINNAGVSDYVVLTIDHHSFEEEVHAAFEAIPKDDCKYFIRNVDTQPLIDRFLTAYERQYKKTDLMRFAGAIGAIKADHPLVKGIEKKWGTYTNTDYGIEFAHQETWPEPRVSEDKKENQISIAFGPLMNWEGEIGYLYSLRIHINKPNVVHVPSSKACPTRLGVTVCQTFDPTLEPDKMRQVNMDNQDEVVKAFVEEFTVNGLKAYASKLGDAFMWKHIFISGMHNGYLFSGGIDDKDYDRVVQSFKEDKARQTAWYEERFAGYMTGEPVTCSENLAIDTFPKRLVGFYAGYDLNGCEYEADTKKLKSYQYYPVPHCANSFDEALGEHDYDVLNGCLYYHDQRVFEETLFTRIVYGDFGEEYFTTRVPEEKKSMGESASEWLRFEDNGKLYIFLRGGAGCGGCVYNDPYMVVDLRTGDIAMRNADLPYLPHNIFSPNRKKSITFDHEQSEQTDWKVRRVKLSVFDYLTFEKNEILSVPDDSSVLALGMGVYFIDDAITWLDDNQVQIQLHEGEGASAGEAVVDEQGVTNYKYTPKGEPIILSVN